MAKYIYLSVNNMVITKGLTIYYISTYSFQAYFIISDNILEPYKLNLLVIIKQLEKAQANESALTESDSLVDLSLMTFW